MNNEHINALQTEVRVRAVRRETALFAATVHISAVDKRKEVGPKSDDCVKRVAFFH
jgi:hypothetical protein